MTLVPGLPYGITAWVGAVSGLGGLFWNVYTKITAGPKLAVTAYAGMVMMPPLPHNPRLLRITVHNDYHLRENST